MSQRRQPLPQRRAPLPSSSQGKLLKPAPQRCQVPRVNVRDTRPTTETRMTRSQRLAEETTSFRQKRQLKQHSQLQQLKFPEYEVMGLGLYIPSTKEIIGDKRKGIPGLGVFEIILPNGGGYGNPHERYSELLNDPRMCPMDNRSTCATCEKTVEECPGHNAYIRLPEPMLHPYFIREIIAVLVSVCNSCGKLLVTEDELRRNGLLRKHGSERLFAIEALAAKRSCLRSFQGSSDNICQENPVFKKKDSNEKNKIFIEQDKVKTILTPRKILDIFQAIDPADVKLMGFDSRSEPSRFILEVLLVEPANIRETRIDDGKSWSTQVTKLYRSILGAIKNLQDKLNGKSIRRRTSEETTIEAAQDELFKHIKELFDVQAKLLPDKEGYIRGNIMSKRVNYSMRTVLSPDPTLAFGEISIPAAAVSLLTPIERVFQHNRQAMQQRLREGRISFITHNPNPSEDDTEARELAGIRKRVTEKMRETYYLKDGDIVERWLENGDYYMPFNRQPTLHRYSFMGYRAVIQGDSSMVERTTNRRGEVIYRPSTKSKADQKTIGLNLFHTTPHNADFDGDEGNVHALQNFEARAEAEVLLNVRNCFFNKQTNTPTMGLVFDAPIAAYLLTDPETLVPAEEFNDAISRYIETSQLASLAGRLEKYGVEMMREDENGEKMYTGQALFSSVLPEDFFYEKGKVIIKEGVLIKGQITADDIGPKKGSIIQVMGQSSYYSPDRVANFITDANKMLDFWLNNYGYSIGLSSCLVEGEEVKAKVRQEVEKARLLVESMGAPPADPVELDKYEKQVMAYISAPSEIAKKHLKETMPADNAFNIAITSGAKGKLENIVQITGFLGQQYIQDKRINEPLTFGERCLPYFSNEDKTLEARGYCTSSYLEGLTPAEMFYHFQFARANLASTAFSTPETGTMQRNVTKTLQDIKVAYDGSVRGTDKSVYQFLYGDDGLDPARLMSVKTKKGEFLSFFDGTTLANQLNARYGY